jgi:hypothetical protein
MNRSLRRGTAALALMAVTFAAQAVLGFDWEPITDVDWAVHEDADRGVRDAAVIFEKIRVDDEEMLKDKCYYSVYSRIRILSSEGRRWGDVVAPYLMKEQRIEEIEGRTVHRDGSVFPLDKSQVFEKEVFVSEGLKVKQKAFSLPAVSEDCIVEYFLRFRLEESPHVWKIQKDIHMLEGEYLWQFCRGKGLVGTEYRAFLKEVVPNYVVRGPEDKLEIQRRPSLKDAKELLFSIEDVPAFESEPFSPPDAALKWQMRHYYGEPGVAAAFWGDISKKWADILDEFTKSNRLAEKAMRDFPFMSSTLQKVNTAYAWVNDNVQNLDINTPDTEVRRSGCVDHVIYQGWGNSVEISAVFYDMLREMDIDAKMAFAIDRDEDLFIPEAKYWQFNKALVAVPLTDDAYTFYQPGYEYLAPGEVDWYYEGVSAMVVGDPDEQFVTIPFSQAESNWVTRHVSLNMNQDMRLTGTIVEECEGQFAQRHRRKLRKSGETELTQYLKEHIADHFATFETDSLSVKDLSNNRRPLVMESSVETDFPGQQAGSLLLLRPCDFFSKQDNPFTSEERKYRIMFPFSQDIVENLEIVLPQGWAADKLPRDTTFSNQVGRVEVTFGSSGGTVSIQNHLTIDQPVWEATAYPDIQELFQARQMFKETTVIVKR